MELLTKNQNILKNAAAAFGVVQGLSWVAMSTACLLVIYKWKPNLSDHDQDSLDSRMAYLIFVFFFDTGGTVQFTGKILDMSGFVGFLSLYLMTDIAWVVLSILVIIKDGTKFYRVLRYWSYTTALICLVDSILVITVGTVYGNCVYDPQHDQFQNIGGWNTACVTGILPVMFIAAKGFLLWFVNVGFAWKLYRMGKILKKRVWGRERQRSWISHR